MIHGAWIEITGLDATYEAVPKRAEDAAEFLASCAANGYRGGNVTIPHKGLALETTEADETARTIGAANTVWVDGDRLRCTNTDAYGFLANLDERAPGWNDRSVDAIVLGAGGAARAIVFALIQRGFERVHVLNRTLRKAEDLEELGDRGAGVVVPHTPDAFEKLAPECDVLVNTTSLGMTGEEKATGWPPDLTALPAHAVVCDIVYAPLRTELLRSASQSGLVAVDGLGMLLHQAVPGFELWFGRRPEVTARLRRRVVADLGEREPVFLGLTGSIGMGKSTTARMFEDAGVPVYDADSAVHRLYRDAAVEPIEAAFPGATGPDGVDRKLLAAQVVGQPEAMKRLERIVHPLVAREQSAFRRSVVEAGWDVAVLDIPLLFETGGDARADAVVCVTAPADIQRDRVMSRGTMSEAQFEAILLKQVADEEKRTRSDFVIDTSLGMNAARDAVARILSTVRDADWMPPLVVG